MNDYIPFRKKINDHLHRHHVEEIPVLIDLCVCTILNDAKNNFRIKMNAVLIRFEREYCSRSLEI